MDAIREYLKKPVYAILLGGIGGLLIGLLLGWVIWPVQWMNAAPENLHPGYQDVYLTALIDSYTRNPDAQLAKSRFEDMGSAGLEAFARLKANPGSLTPDQIAAFEAAVNVSVMPAPAGTTLVEGEEPAGGAGNLTTLLVVMCLLTVLLGAGVVIYFVLQNRRRLPQAATPAMQAQEAARQAEWTDYAAMGEEAPMAQFMASYRIGDDLFDDSFSIDSPTGEFLGECGVGISETIGVGDPKKVTAFEVWLFDKNDIQTVTKVLMSAHAFNDAGIRERLSAKGEPILVEPGSQTVLDTATLRLVTRIVDMSYGEGALPANSFYESLILELAVWQK
jgi:hypothetical protein